MLSVLSNGQNEKLNSVTIFIDAANINVVSLENVFVLLEGQH